MRKITKIEILYAIALIVLVYIIFRLLFEDILQGRNIDFNLQDVIWLSISCIVFVWIAYKFYKYTQPLLSDRLILVIVIASVFFSLVLQKEIVCQKDIANGEKEFVNPLYPLYQNISKKYHLDLSFTKKVWEQRGPRNYKINDIFHQPKKSIDILFIGDSAIAWGVIPQVIEQMTDKKVAMYAYEANVLTETTCNLYNKLATYYLKDDGVIILSFDSKNVARSPKMISMSVRQFREIMKWKEGDFDNYSKQIEKSFYARYLAYGVFHKKYNQISKNLKELTGLGLKSPIVYRKYIENRINPKLHKAKIANENEKTKFLRWDMRSITQYNPHFKDLAFYNNDEPVKPYIDKNIEENAKAAAKIFGKHKIYMVNLFNNKESYQLTREIYQRYYKHLGFALCDLGLLLQDNRHYIMQEDGTHLNARTHMGNEGGLMKSILIGQWFQNYFSEQSK
jgi:hypothetical protein